MDPNATLAELRAVIAELREYESCGDVEGMASRGCDLANWVQDLDEWITRGGFLPDAWLTQAIRGQERALARTHVPGDTPFSQAPADLHISEVTS